MKTEKVGMNILSGEYETRVCDKRPDRLYCGVSGWNFITADRPERYVP